MSGDSRLDPSLRERIAALAERYRLPPAAPAQLELLLALLVEDPHAPTSIRDPTRAVDDHLADSLVALELEQVANASRVADLGSGAGLPGLPLAIARPEAAFTLLESSARKCAFLERAVEACGLSNVEVVHVRAESWRDGIGTHDLVTARALAQLDVVAEYAAPLLAVGGTLVAWRGRRDPESDAAGARAAELLGMSAPEVRPVRPYPSAEHRHLYLISKVMDTPARFPRRPGIAAKRPLGAAQLPAGNLSDRIRR